MSDFFPMDYDFKASLDRPQWIPTDIYGQDYYYARNCHNLIHKKRA